jgi:uridylate kinase
VRERILLKISGEALGGNNGLGYDPTFIKELVTDIGRVNESHVDIAIVVGGGNLFRGNQGNALGLQTSCADHMGMLATIMNGVALQNIFRNIGIPSVMLSAIDCPHVCDTFTVEKGLAVLNSHQILLCVGGTGCPYFTTDTASVIKASELKCSVLMKGTKVSGIFSEDPMMHKNAKHFTHISYQEVMAKRLNVMDMTAFEIAEKQKLPIVVFSLFQPNPISSVLAKTCQFTVVNENGQKMESSC